MNLFRELEILVDNLNAGRPQCPVGLNTLVVPRKNSQNVATSENQPYVYLNCGHVQVSKSFSCTGAQLEERGTLSLPRPKVARRIGAGVKKSVINLHTKKFSLGSFQ